VLIKELEEILKQIDGKPRQRQLECARVLGIIVESWNNRSSRWLDSWDVEVELMRRRRRRKKPSPRSRD
jgi:hypothetical protein